MSLTKSQNDAYKKAGADKLDAFLVDPDQVWIIGLDTEDGEDHPLYDDRIHAPLPKEFVRNVESVGVKKPIIVRVIEGDLVAVDGRQRLRALREANASRKKKGLESLKIPVKHEQGGADADATTTMVTANTFTLQDGPYQQAVKAKKLQSMGVPDADIAVAMGVSLATLRNRFRLLELPSDVVKAIDKIGPMAALEIGKIEDKEERAEALNEAKSSTKKWGTAAKAKKKAKKAKKKSGKGGDDKPERPSVSFIKKLVQTEAFSDLDKGVQRAFMFVLGEIGPKSIPGLSKCVNELEEEE